MSEYGKKVTLRVYRALGRGALVGAVSVRRPAGQAVWEGEGEYYLPVSVDPDGSLWVESPLDGVWHVDAGLSADQLAAVRSLIAGEER